MFAITVLFVTLQVLTLVSQSHQECPPVDPPEHGRIETVIYRAYSGFRVLCDPGYIIHGYPLVNCLNNQWTSSTPICVERRHCQLPKPPTHGTVEGCATTRLPRVSEKCSFRCNDGYTLKGPTSLTCRPTGKYTDDEGRENFPECVETPCLNLNCEQMCVPENGRHRCGCKRGFILNKSDRRSCERNNGPPIYPSNNPCDVNNGGCDHICQNSRHGVICSCRPGFVRTGIGLKKCRPSTTHSAGSTKKPVYQSSPCQINKGGCDHYCTVSITGETFCSCREGYERGGEDMKQCIKITPPEPQSIFPSINCEVNNGGCEHECEIRGGVVQCSCREGYILHPDGKFCTNACQVNNGGCGHICEIKEGAIQCSCREGYSLFSDGKRCLDINECSRNDLNKCQQDCKNTRGSYLCSCRRGFILKDGYRCEDVDECLSEYSNNCNHFCHNTEGSFTCSCRPGFILMDGHRCEGCGKNSYWSFELNSCTECPINAHTDSEGKASVRDCVCDSGFVGNPAYGIPCEDIDECLIDNFGCTYNCVNVPGSAYCNCPIGFKLNHNNKTCIDIDECMIKNGGCEGTCHNLHGSFRCSCPEGYASSNKDKYSCEDVDECLDDNGGCEQKCINYAGGYYCACENGYRLNSGLKNCTVIQCPALPVPPHSNMTCTKNGKKIGDVEYYPRDTKCKFSCSRGFKHASNSFMKCQNDGSWYGTLPECRAQNCNPLNVPENGAVHPSFCSTQGVEVKQRCAFSCNPGYKLEGHPVLTCKNNLNWTHEVPVCLENIHPRIECPSDITETLNPGNNTHSITLQEPITNVESYNVQPEWVSIGASTEFPAGVTRVTFTTVSLNSKKTAKCVTTITILDEEPPVFEYCPGSIQIEDSEAEGAFVSWEEPVVTDNVQVESVFSISEHNTTFAPGTYVVEYIARDVSGNIASCYFNVSITRMSCSNLADPPHGNANCVHWMYGTLCEPQCEDGYMRNPEDPVYYSCDDSGIWEPTDTITECLKFIPLTSYNCPDGFTLKANNETAEEICIECSSNQLWSTTTKECEEKQ